LLRGGGGAAGAGQAGRPEAVDGGMMGHGGWGEDRDGGGRGRTGWGGTTTADDAGITTVSRQRLLLRSMSVADSVLQPSG